MTALFIASSVLTVSAVFFDFPKPFSQLVRELFARGTEPERPKALDVKAAAVGDMVTSTTADSTETRRSESHNVGCESGSSARVTYDIPGNVEVLAHGAKWVDIDNIKEHAARTERVGETVVATGEIRGLDRNIVRDCPGGGHATLELSASVRTKSVESNPATIDLGTSQLIDQAVVFAVLPSGTTAPLRVRGFRAALRPSGTQDDYVNVEVGCSTGPSLTKVSRTVAFVGVELWCDGDGLHVQRVVTTQG